MIQVRNLGKQYRIEGSPFWALRHLNLEVAPGVALGITGSNGSGKSTLLKLLARVTRPTEGTIELGGRVGALLEVGTGFHHELTGRENVYLSGAILGMGKAEVKRHFDEIVAFSEIEPFLDTPVKRYSSGMFLRLGFSIMAHLRAEILLVDEILSVGDGPFQKKCLSKMRAVVQGGKTVIFVSHEREKIDILCDRVITMHEGSIIESKAGLQSSDLLSLESGTRLSTDCHS